MKTTVLHCASPSQWLAIVWETLFYSTMSYACLMETPPVALADLNNPPKSMLAFQGRIIKNFAQVIDTRTKPHSGFLLELHVEKNFQDCHARNFY